MKPNGWIRDYRQELESEIWKMPPLYHRVWQWLKYQANHADKEIPMRGGSRLVIKRGQHLTSYRMIAEGVCWYERHVKKTPNPKTIKTILTWLSRREMIRVQTHGELPVNSPSPPGKALKSNALYTLVTICNYSLYQEAGDSQSNTESNTQVTVGKQSVDTNNNDNKDKNDKKHIYITSATEIELQLLTVFQSVKNYPFNETTDLKLIRQLSKEFPAIDLLRQANKWHTYKLDKPLEKKSNPRSQFRNWIEMESKKKGGQAYATSKEQPPAANGTSKYNGKYTIVK